MMDDVSGVDDPVAERAFARRVLLRYQSPTLGSRCGLRFIHPHDPAQFDEHGFPVVDTCECRLLKSHAFAVGCICEHEVECPVYALDPDGREHYGPRPVR